MKLAHEYVYMYSHGMVVGCYESTRNKTASTRARQFCWLISTDGTVTQTILL